MNKDIVKMLNNELSAEKVMKYTPNELAHLLLEKGIIVTIGDLNGIVVEGIQRVFISDVELPIHYYRENEEMNEKNRNVEIGDQLTDQYIANNFND